MWDATEFREIWMECKSEGLDFTESLEKVREMKPTTVGHTRVQEEGLESGGFNTEPAVLNWQMSEASTRRGKLLPPEQ